MAAVLQALVVSLVILGFVLFMLCVVLASSLNHCLLCFMCFILSVYLSVSSLHF